MSDDIYRDERATWERLKPELLAEHEGKFVLIRGTEVAGIFETFDDAVEFGFGRWGYVSLYVHKIAAEEETEFLPIYDVTSWRS